MEETTVLSLSVLQNVIQIVIKNKTYLVPKQSISYVELATKLYIAMNTNDTLEFYIRDVDRALIHQRLLTLLAG